MDETQLAKELADGDPRAIEILVARHHTAVYRFLRHLSRHVEDAEDLAQQSLMRALKGAGRFDGRSTMRAWLLGIAFHEFTRWRRRRIWLPLTADRPKPGDDYERLLEADALLDALGRLAEPIRAVFLLHYVEELPIVEIAVGLGIPEGTVKSRLHTARSRLCALLGKEFNYATTPCNP